jgi:sulfate adenylyltransferase subunit 2
LSDHNNYQLTHLQQLEAESIFIMREVAAQFGKPALLFSGGKASIVMVRLAQKAFWPAKLPFPLVHIDTGHNFEETIQFRDDLVKNVGGDLVIASVQEEIDEGRVKEEPGLNPSRNRLQIPVLLNVIGKNNYDACLGGARRDEEKARAKERFFSHRNSFGEWDPPRQAS